MREIKFRAWDKIKNEIFVPTRINLWLLNQLSKYSDGSGTIASNDCVLMQFTGLKDKNSVDVYEGDIVKVDLRGVQATSTGSISKFEGVGKVSFGWLRGQYGVEIINAPQFTPNYIPFYDGSAEFEVIGNTYENPELLT